MKFYTEEEAYDLNKKEQVALLKERGVKATTKMLEKTLVKKILESNPEPEPKLEELVEKNEVKEEKTEETVQVKEKEEVQDSVVCDRCGSVMEYIWDCGNHKDYECPKCHSKTSIGG